MTRFSQEVKSCAISDSGDRLSGDAACGACAWTDAAATSRNDRESAAAPLSLLRTTVLVRQRLAHTLTTLIGITATLRRSPGETTYL